MEVSWLRKEGRVDLQSAGTEKDNRVYISGVYFSSEHCVYGENSTPFIQKGRAEEINSKLLGLINSESPLHHFVELPKT